LSLVKVYEKQTADILFIYEGPFYHTLREYSLIRVILDTIGTVDYYWSGMACGLISKLGAERFVKGRGYKLIVIIYFNKGLSKEIGELVETGLREGCSFLFLVQSEDCNVVLEDIGLVYSSAKPVCNVSTSLVADHEALLGVWRAGVREWCICGYYRVYGGSGCYGVVLANESWWGERHALVVLGEVRKGRVAAIAPYLFAEDVYDNRVLLENIVRWLLRMEVKGGESPYYPLKSLESERARLLNETECLREEVSRLINESERLRKLIEVLRSNYTEALESTPEYRALKGRVLELEAQLNKTRRLLNESLREKALLEEEVGMLKKRVAELEDRLRFPYRVLGLAIAVSIVVGFYAGYVVGKRRGGSGET